MKHRSAFAIFLLSLLTSFPAFAQGVSRPATVMLVARLESLSIAQTSTLASTQSLHPAPKSGPAALAVTSSWALPAHSTTMRVVAYTGPSSAAFDDPSQPARPSQSGLVDETIRENCLPIFIQTPVTNAFTSRTDAISADPFPLAGAAPPGALLIVAQAL